MSDTKTRAASGQDRTEWHNIIAWQRLAEIVGEYVKKGSKIYIEGRLQTSSWEDKQSGEKKYKTEVVASDLVLLGGGESNGDIRPRRETREPVPAGRVQDSTEITDEDIPF